MTTLEKAKLKKSDDQKNIGKYRVDVNITEYHIISKSIFLRIIFPKFTRIRQLFHAKDACRNVKNKHVKTERTDFLIIIQYNS